MKRKISLIIEVDYHVGRDFVWSGRERDLERELRLLPWQRWQR